MLRTVLMVVVGFVLVGLAVALLQVFNGDVGALFEWAWDSALGLINAIADFFVNNSLFQRAVS